MTDDLLPLYNAELRHLRELGRIFAQDNPGVAAALDLGSDHVEDPHISRLVESFAYLNARTQYRIEDDFPEITEAYLNVVYPHFLRPVPSMSIAHFELPETQAELTQGYQLDAGSELETPPISGEPCRFRTGYPVQLWPFKVDSAELRHGAAPLPPGISGTPGTLTIRLSTLSKGVSFGQFTDFQTLRFFIKGGRLDVNRLYAEIFRRQTRFVVASDSHSSYLPPNAVSPVGFAQDEGLLPLDARSFIGYRTLLEYFVFPEKYHFFDIDLSSVNMSRFGTSMQVIIQLPEENTDLENAVSDNTFVLGCTPAVNLFSMPAEDFKLDEGEFEHPVVADRRRQNAVEIYSIDKVQLTAGRVRNRMVAPFYSRQHHNRGDEADVAYWYANRRASPDGGTELWISLVDLSNSPFADDDAVVHLEATCTNRNLARQMPFGKTLDMQLSGKAAGIARCSLLTRPTESFRPDLGQGVRWRLVSHLSLNGLSLEDIDDAATGLQEILTLYDRVGTSATKEMIQGLESIRYERATARVTDRVEGRLSSFVCRGLDAHLTLNPDNFQDGSMFLFASVLERFLALYCNLNSFVRTSLHVPHDNQPIYEWPPRTGDQEIL